MSLKEKMFSLKKSSSSFRLSDVTSFTFGPFVSRFWMMRKHIISMSKDQLKNDAPFYSWECISLSIKDKWDVYLIIRNDEIMSYFLKLLIART